MSAPAEHPVLAASLESTKVEYVRLGKSGLKVSVPIFGAMSIGDPQWASWILDEEKVRWQKNNSLCLSLARALSLSS